MQLTSNIVIQTPKFQSPFSKEETFGYIYMTICVVNGKGYIGQKHSSEFIKTYLGSGKLLTRAIMKYGVTNFVVFPFDWATSQEELDQKEIYWIDFYNTAKDREHFYNIGSGGLYGFGKYWKNMTAEEKLEFSKKLSKPRKYMPPKSEETKCRIRESNIKTWSIPEVLEKVSGKNNPFYGKSHSDETKALISTRVKEAFSSPNMKEWLQNRNTYHGHLSETTRNRMSDAAKKRWQSNKMDCSKKKVSVYGIIYPSISKGIKASGLTRAKFLYRLDNPEFPEFFRI